jgi:hypothetical protein
MLDDLIIVKINLSDFLHNLLNSNDLFFDRRNCDNLLLDEGHLDDSVNVLIYDFVISNYNWFFCSNLDESWNFHNFLDNLLNLIDFGNFVNNLHDFLMNSCDLFNPLFNLRC